MKFRSLMVMAVLASTMTFQTVYAQEMFSINEMTSYLHTDVYRQIERQTDSGVVDKLPVILAKLRNSESDLIVPGYPSASSLNLVISIVNELAAQGQNEITSGDIKKILNILNRNNVMEMSTETSEIVEPLLAQLDRITVGEIKTGFIRKESKRAMSFFGKDGQDIQLSIPKDLTSGLDPQFSDLDYTLVIENGSKFVLNSVDEKEGSSIAKNLSSAQLDANSEASTLSTIQGLKYHLQPGLAENSSQYFATNSQKVISVVSEDIYLKVNLAKLMNSQSKLSSFIPDKLNARIYPERILSMPGMKDFQTRERLSPVIIMIKPTKALPKILFSIDG